MNDLRLAKGKNAMIIVAHPDDETIWMGGTILNNKDLNWTIYSLCRSSDTDREPKFGKVCALYGAKPMISDLDDEDILNLDECVKDAEQLLEKNIVNEKIDYLFTHGENGEYGHERHIAVHLAINNLIKRKTIKPEAVFCFCYKKNKENKLPLMLTGNDSDVIINLSRDIFRRKRKIVAEMYGYPYEGVDVGLCVNPEAFRQLKYKN